MGAASGTGPVMGCVVEYLRRRGRATMGEIAAHVGRKPNQLGACITRLRRRGVIRRSSAGCYAYTTPTPVVRHASWTAEQIQADIREEAIALGHLDLHHRLWTPGVE